MILSTTFGWIVAAVFGLIFGSFANVLVARLPSGKSLVKPGSQCPQCKKPVRCFDNIPIVSYLLLRGRCRSCRKKISVRYPIIEFLTALLFVACVSRFGLTYAVVAHGWSLMVICIAITFIDLEHRIIPDLLSLTGVVLGILTSWMIPELGMIQSILGAGFGFSFFYLLAWIYQARTGHTGLGGGDIKFLAMVGAFLGPAGVITTVLVSSIVGSVIGVAWGIASKKKKIMKVAVPYGPFLVIGALCYYFWGEILWLRFMNPM